jgi:hypothetical protein
MKKSGDENLQAMVVVDTTWLFKNLRKLRVDMRTVNIWVGSGGSTSGSSSSCAEKKVFKVEDVNQNGDADGNGEKVERDTYSSDFDNLSIQFARTRLPS